MNGIFVVKKPLFISSNQFIQSLKNSWKVKKIGYSGTLDPFAKGILIVATNSFTKILKLLDLEKKEYIATIFLGAISRSLDIELVEKIVNIKKVDEEKVKDVLKSLEGEIEYSPPLFSAKRVNGKRAYEFARSGKKINLPKIKSKIYKIELINYSFPFITFKATVSKGTYIRSLAEIICNKLEVVGSLSYLERIKEGKFFKRKG